MITRCSFSGVAFVHNSAENDLFPEGVVKDELDCLMFDFEVCLRAICFLVFILE